MSTMPATFSRASWVRELTTELRSTEQVHQRLGELKAPYANQRRHNPYDLQAPVVKTCKPITLEAAAGTSSAVGVTLLSVSDVVQHEVLDLASLPAVPTTANNTATPGELAADIKTVMLGQAPHDLPVETISRLIHYLTQVVPHRVERAGSRRNAGCVYVDVRRDDMGKLQTLHQRVLFLAKGRVLTVAEAQRASLRAACVHLRATIDSARPDVASQPGPEIKVSMPLWPATFEEARNPRPHQ